MSSETDPNCRETKETILKSVLQASKKHACPYVGCNFTFDRPWKLNMHLNTHTNQRPFKCDHPECTKAYVNNSHLQRHKSISHGKNKPKSLDIHCSFNECKKVFANKWSLKKHCASHHISDTHKCEVCGKGFQKYSKLKSHMYEHWVLDPFICKICQESFKTKLEFKKHERTHRVYDCQHAGCNEKFSSWNAVRTHMKITHPARYKCDTCSHFFKNKWTLTEHVLSHLPFNERDIIMCPYKDCDRYYFYERNLEAHVKSYHHDINHPCNFKDCGKTFTSKRRLRDHQKVHTESYIKQNKCVKTKTQRKPRKDKGVRKKSMASLLSGIILPKNIDENLAQNKNNPELVDYVEKVKSLLCKDETSKIDVINKNESFSEA